jgi:hypothetical protein
VIFLVIWPEEGWSAGGASTVFADRSLMPMVANAALSRGALSPSSCPERPCAVLSLLGRALQSGSSAVAGMTELPIAQYSSREVCSLNRSLIRLFLM